MKKAFWIILLLIFILLVYIVYQWRYIHATNDMPYKNLSYFGTGGCLIYANIEYDGVIYPVVQTNTFMVERLSIRNKFVRMNLYPIYLKEAIKHEWSIKVDKELFDEFGYDIVDRKLIALYSKIDFKTDTTILKGDRIAEKFEGEHYKAILYVLLRQGIKCCIACESGTTFIGSDQ